MAAEKNGLSKISEYLFPYHSCTYVSKLSKEAILDRIGKKTEPEQFFRLSGWLSGNKKTKEYEGKVDLDAFKIVKISKRKNSYSPVILGEISSSNQNTKVDIKMRLRYFVLVFTPIWIVIVGSSLLTNGSAFRQFDLENIDYWFPLFILIAIYVVTTVSFHYQVTKAKKSLELMIEPTDNIDSGASWIIRN